MYKNDIIFSVKKITKIYQLGENKIKALNEISLDIYKNDFLIITGRNGSGKSTLLHQLGLLDNPNSGTIIFNNIEATKLKESEKARLRLNNIGYIFQEYALIAELSALENVMLPAIAIGNFYEAKERSKRLLEKVGLEKKFKNLPGQLSGGEQQKVAIARALINNPSIIFADEPTANLDTIAAREILEIFKQLNKEGHTIVMVTHEPEEESYANRIIKLQDGVIIYEQLSR